VVCDNKGLPETADRANVLCVTAAENGVVNAAAEVANATKITNFHITED
jgi:hypothetical protein